MGLRGVATLAERGYVINGIVATASGWYAMVNSQKLLIYFGTHSVTLSDISS